MSIGATGSKRYSSSTESSIPKRHKNNQSLVSMSASSISAHADQVALFSTQLFEILSEGDVSFEAFPKQPINQWSPRLRELHNQINEKQKKSIEDAKNLITKYGSSYLTSKVPYKLVEIPNKDITILEWFLNHLTYSVNDKIELLLLLSEKDLQEMNSVLILMCFKLAFKMPEKEKLFLKLIPYVFPQHIKLPFKISNSIFLYEDNF